MENIKVTSSTKTFNINGKTYNNFEDIPEDIRNKLDKDGNGKIDFVENFENGNNSFLSNGFGNNNKSTFFDKDILKLLQIIFLILIVVIASFTVPIILEK